LLLGLGRLALALRRLPCGETSSYEQTSSYEHAALLYIYIKDMGVSLERIHFKKKKNI
jgi:hypothetical protein